MTRIRNVLQHRPDRFRKRHAQNKLSREDTPLQSTSADYDGIKMHGHFVKPQMEPDGASSDSVYSLEAKDTHATALETFSSGEENTTYSDENRNERNANYSEYYRRQVEDGTKFLDPASEGSHQEMSGHDFIDLVQESSAIKTNNLEDSNYRDHRDDDETHSHESYDQPQTIQFVDSEDGKVFNITRENQNVDLKGHDGILQNVRSLEETNTFENDECSKTLNTNTETLYTMQSLNDVDVEQLNFSNRFRNLHVQVGEKGEDFEARDEVNLHETSDIDGETSQPEGDSLLYDCDDGEMYIPIQAPDDQQGSIYSDQGVQHEEDGNFFEQLRNVQSRHTNDYQHLEPMGIVEEVQPENWKSLREQIHFKDQQNVHSQQQKERPFSPQLEDPYLSDGNSSWEEGSFATGASRTVSRVDTSCNDDETYDGTYDGTEYYSEDETYVERKGDRPFVRMLKKLRKMNVNDEQSSGESSDEENDENDDDRKKRSKGRRKRRTKNSSVTSTIFNSIRQIGTDILDETIDFAEKQDRLSRSNVGNGSDKILNSFTELLSCGVSSP
mmetsp:Transcript_6749/g.16577  ORF Transcript_6749/g.16577 Transcript_6749/m.16577 type:complete len:556 (-) Transcript_6749:168-1835(-)